MPAPAIVLVRPQLGENIGAAARIMSNFGFETIRLVAPRDGWPNRKALEMSAGGLPILERAELYADLPAALKDVHIAYATSARPRDIDKRMTNPWDAVAELRAQGGEGRRTALVFGPERTGLANEDLALMDALIAIPTHPANPSLNLAQSVAVLGYEWFKALPDAAPAAPPPRAPEDMPATKEELHGFFTHLEEALDAANHFRAEEKKPVMWQNLQNIFLRAPYTSQEIRTLRGVIRTLARKR